MDLFHRTQLPDLVLCLHLGQTNVIKVLLKLRLGAPTVSRAPTLVSDRSTFSKPAGWSTISKSAATTAVQGGYIAVQGGYIPVQGGYIPVQGGYIPVQKNLKKLYLGG